MTDKSRTTTTATTDDLREDERAIVIRASGLFPADTGTDTDTSPIAASR